MVKFGFQELTSFQTKERERDRGESSQWQTAIVIYPLWKRCISSSSPPPVRPISSPRNFEILNVTSSQDRDYGLEGKVSPELFNTQRIARSSVFLIPKRPSRRTVQDFQFFSSKYFPSNFSFFFFFLFLTFAWFLFYPRSESFVLRSESRIYVHPCKNRAHSCCAFNERSTREIIKSLINKRMLINSINWIRYNSIESSNSIFPILWIIKARSIGEKSLSKFLKRRKKNYKKLVMA